MRLIDADKARKEATIDLVVHLLDRQPTIDAVPVEQFKAQVIALVKSLEVVLGCLGVSVLTREIERMKVAEPSKEV